MKRAAALGGAVLGGGATVGSVTADRGGGASGERSVVQQVDTDLQPGVTLFDLNEDGTYAATVEAVSQNPRDDAHPRPAHITSNGRSTVDYAASIVKPSNAPALSDLEQLRYDFYEGPKNANPNASGGIAPDETFLVVENADGRHGMYLSYDATGSAPAEQWQTFDVLTRLQGQTGGTSRWFEYTGIEEGYTNQVFDSVVERFGADARLVRVGVGHGDAVNPATLDVYYDNLVVNDRTNRFPVSVAKRVGHASPF